MGNDLTKISDYNDFLTLLIQNFKDKPKFKQMLSLLADQCNDIETALLELLTAFDIDTAIGEQLNVIGRIVGLERNGRDDESYRTLLKVKIAINFSAGTPESLIQAAVNLYNATDVQYVPIYPAKVRLWTNGDIGLFVTFQLELDVPNDLMELDDGGILEVQQPDDIAEDLLFQILPAGVGLILPDDLILDDNGFLFLSDGDPEDHVIVT